MAWTADEFRVTFSGLSMRYFPFKIFVLCILLPPVLYLLSVQWIEQYMEARYTTEVKKICTGDIKPLLDGKTRLKEALSKNIDGYLASRNALAKDLRITLTVTSKSGTILYPQTFEDDQGLLKTSSDPLGLAEENYRFLNEGLNIKLSVSLDPNSFLSYLILSVFIAISILFLYYFYRKLMNKAIKDNEESQKQWERILKRDQESRWALEILEQNRKELGDRLEDMKIKLSEANRSEDGMIEEIESLEEKITKNERLQVQQQEEIETLKAQIEQAKTGKPKKSKQKTKQYDFIFKRFKTIYKNLSFHERAIDGYNDLEDTLKLKCEEVIHLLNDEPDQVVIKRKVFGKKNRETVFEVLFAYKGRLYFRRLKDNTIEILAVGTKNTQDRELDFLDRL